MPSIFNKLSTELRLEIWILVVSDTFKYDSRMPSIVKALRCEPALYEEALEAFYRNNAYVFQMANGWSFLDMTMSTISTICRLKIVVDHNYQKVAGHPDCLLKISHGRSGVYFIKDLAVLAPRAVNVTEVEIEARCADQRRTYLVYKHNDSSTFTSDADRAIGTRPTHLSLLTGLAFAEDYGGGKMVIPTFIFSDEASSVDAWHGIRARD